MGTNYYMVVNSCAQCGRGEEDLHIGKSSMGWCFSLNTHPDEQINSLEDWRAAWHGNRIRNEYGETITPEEMERVIAKRPPKARESTPFGYDSWERFYEDNHAEPGPNGLLRHRIDGRLCIGHGDGTFDLMRGEFS